MTSNRANRVQRSRRKGYQTPAGTIYVGRPTKWGNPFMARRSGRATASLHQPKVWGHAKSVILHRRWLTGEIAALGLERLGFCPHEVDALQRLRARVLTDVHQLAGHDLACWCPLTSKWCHAELLLDLAGEHAELESFAA